MASKNGSTPFTFFKTVEIDPVSVAANTVAAQTFVVKGLREWMMPRVEMPDIEAGLGISQASCSDKDELKIWFINPTAGAIDGAAQTCHIYVP